MAREHLSHAAELCRHNVSIAALRRSGAADYFTVRTKASSLRGEHHEADAMLQATGQPTAPRNAISQFPRQIAPETYWFSTCLPFEANGREVHNHNSCFLVCGDRASVLVDTGLPFQWAQLKHQLLAVLGNRPLTHVFATHPEAPHMGNAGKLLELFPDAKLIGDLRNYKLYFPHLTHRLSPKKPGDVIDLGGRRLTIVPAVVHDLPNTLWAYETPHRILFVSDGYPYTHLHEADQCVMTSEELPSQPLPEDTGPVIEGALGWTRHVPAELVIRDIEALLERYPPALIAPAHGGVITNPIAMTELFKAGLRRISGAPVS